MLAPPVTIILGSPTDEPAFDESGAGKFLTDAGILWDLSFISAHRNPAALDAFCKERVANGTKAFLTGAGKAAALPGAAAGVTEQEVPVLGVPLDEFGVHSIQEMPPGVPVGGFGIGPHGLYNAAIFAAQIVYASDPVGRAAKLVPLLAAKRKPPKIQARTSWDDAEELNEGKTKQILQDPTDPNRVIIRSKDDITAGDGAKHDVLVDKSKLATTTTANCFELLNRKGVPTHYLGQLDPRSFLARNVEMIPLELVCRRLATGSYLKRNPEAIEGEVFGDLVFEFFYKDDARHDPIVIPEMVGDRLMLNLYTASQPIGHESFLEQIPSPWTAEQLEKLESQARQTFEILEAAWAEQGITLVDLKIECGFDAETGEIIVADVVDNDSWRIWPGGEKSEMLDKQVYRDLQGVDDPAAVAKALGGIKKNYAMVAEKSGNFATAA